MKKPIAKDDQLFIVYPSEKSLTWKESNEFAIKMGGSLLSIEEIRGFMAKYQGVEEWSQQWFFDHVSFNYWSYATLIEDKDGAWVATGNPNN